MTESVRPSKQFVLRGSLAIGIVAIVLVVQTDWFRAIFHKEPLAPLPPAQTVGDIVGKDTNKNGIPDWEEKLWGLDPTVLYTNGIPNKTIIEDKKKAFGVNTTNVPANETDALARELLTITTALGQSGEVTNENLSDVAARLADSVEFKELSNHYSLKDLQTVKTTKESLTAYYRAVANINNKYDTDFAEMDTVIAGIESDDLSSLGELLETKKQYQQFAQELTSVPTPVGIEDLHLHMINSIYGVASSLQYLAELPENGVNAFAGVALYKIYDQQLTETITNMEEYLQRYGIL